MFKKENEKLLPLRLQFFADNNDSENSGSENSGSDDTGENSNGKDNSNNDENNDDTDEKKFSQKDLNKLLAREKRDGKNSVLKSLGFKTEEEAKNAFNLLKTLTDTQKTSEQKMKDEKDKIAETLDDEKKRADVAESKLACLMNGVSKDSIEDVLAIANSKVDEDNSLDDVIKKMKKDSKYSMFFDGTSKGTGNPPGHGKNGSSKENYGSSIALNNKPKQVKKSYFD